MVEEDQISSTSGRSVSTETHFILKRIFFCIIDRIQKKCYEYGHRAMINILFIRGRRTQSGRNPCGLLTIPVTTYRGPKGPAHFVDLPPQFVLNSVWCRSRLVAFSRRYARQLWPYALIPYWRIIHSTRLSPILALKTPLISRPANVLRFGQAHFIEALQSNVIERGIEAYRYMAKCVICRRIHRIIYRKVLIYRQ